MPWRDPQTDELPLRHRLAARSLAEKVADLSGAMLSAASIAAIVTIALALLGGEALLRSDEPLVGPAWLWLVITLGSWGLLVLSCFWQQSEQDPSLQHLQSLVLGLVLGGVAWAAGHYGLVRFSDGWPSVSVHSAWVDWMYDPGGQPQWPAFAAYYGAVFLSIRWWRYCNPLRRQRFSLGAVLWSVLVAWLWNLLWSFPQPWGFFVTGGICLTTQLAAPWLTPAQRRELLALSPGSAEPVR